MALPKVIPALADLTQDIAGPVPVELLYAWAAGDQEAAHAESLLAPFRVEGTVVSSDTSGLSRLTKERDLLDVLALISEPKQILHAIAVEIGGRAIGTWVADNTQVLYPDSIETPAIVAAMSEAERRITCELPIGVGMCVHRGAFYELGAGLYGHDAHLVESLAEHHAGPGEILVTRPVKDACPAEFRFVPRGTFAGTHAPEVFLLGEAPRVRHLEASNRRYPHPYPVEFFDLLVELKRAEDKDALRRRIYDRYLKQLVVVFVAREREPDRASRAPALLDELVANVLLDALVFGLESVRGHVAGLGGGLGILTFHEPQDALDAAQALRRRFTANGLPVKIGMAGGPVLLFSNPRGRSGITGNPVNVASKLSEDHGIAGRIRIAGNLAAQLPGLSAAEPFEIIAGGVVLLGVTL
jgi:class 3 adenylate cyclase